MPNVTVEVWDATGNKRQSVEMPDDAPVKRILIVLLEKMRFPQCAPDGQPLSYKIHHRASGKQLLEGQTLADVPVKNGDVLRLQPEITAGAEEGDDRFERVRLIPWWEQSRLAAAKVLVVGAGALGNEIIKNLALLGVGRVLIADMDRVENSNLSRSILYRAADNGRPKAVAAAEAAREIYPGMHAAAFEGNVAYELGLGAFRWADVVLAGVDNREARLAVNRACYKVDRPWIDGAIEQISGCARVFVPDGPCYECTMTEADWRLLGARRSCNLLSRDQMEEGKTPTTCTVSSIIAAVQCQEAVKLLHGLGPIAGRALVFDGVGAEAYQVEFQRKEDCLSHDTLREIVPLDAGAADISLGQLLEKARELLGPGAHLELGRDVLEKLVCPKCGAEESVGASLGKVSGDLAWCPGCPGVRREVVVFHQITGSEAFLDLPAARIGVPAWDIVIARAGPRCVGLELAADAKSVLGDLIETEEALEWV